MYSRPNTPSPSTRPNTHPQVLRSVANWSGSERLDTSIYRAYLSAIRNAKRSIYIENQFFVSTVTGNSDVHNRITSALFRRIKYVRW